MMIDATWSTILSASMAQVGETKVISHRWDASLENQLPLVLRKKLQMSSGHTITLANVTDSFGEWVTDLTLIGVAIYQS